MHIPNYPICFYCNLKRKNNYFFLILIKKKKRNLIVFSDFSELFSLFYYIISKSMKKKLDVSICNINIIYASKVKIFFHKKMNIYYCLTKKSEIYIIQCCNIPSGGGARCSSIDICGSDGYVSGLQQRYTHSHTCDCTHSYM